MDTNLLLATLLAYIVAGRLVMRQTSGRVQEILFAGLNLAGPAHNK